MQKQISTIDIPKRSPEIKFFTEELAIVCEIACIAIPITINIIPYNTHYFQVPYKQYNLRENTAFPYPYSNNSYNKQMGWVIQIEKPLHSFPISTLSIILF
jgi:hypothetical protein